MYDEARDSPRCSSFALTVQHRMPTALAAFISHHVYNGRLTSAPGVSGSDSAVQWVDVPGGHTEYGRGSSSPFNSAESRAVCALVDAMEREGHLRAGMTGVVITPYLRQRSLIEKECRSSALNGGRWDVKTVDSYQARRRTIRMKMRRMRVVASDTNDNGRERIG